MVFRAKANPRRSEATAASQRALATMPQNPTYRNTSGALMEGMSPGIQESATYSRSQRRTELFKAPGPTPSVLYRPRNGVDTIGIHQGYKEYDNVSPLSTPMISHSRVEPLAARSESGKPDLETVEDHNSGELGDTNSMLQRLYQVQQGCNLFETPSWDPGAHLSSPPAIPSEQQYGNFVGMADSQIPGFNDSGLDMTDDYLYRWDDNRDEMQYVTAEDNRSDIVDCPSDTTSSVINTDQECTSMTQGDQLPDNGLPDHLAHDWNAPTIPLFYDPVLQPHIDHGLISDNIFGVDNPYWGPFMVNAEPDTLEVRQGRISQYGSDPGAPLPQYDVARYINPSNILTGMSSVPSDLYSEVIDPDASIASFQEDVNVLQAQELITTPSTHQLSTAREPGIVFSGVGYPVEFRPTHTAADGLHCGQCDTSFKGKYARSNLGRHRRSLHENKKFPCEIPGCNQGPYTRYKYLMNHFERQHSE